MTIDRVEDGEIASSRDEHDIMGVVRQPGVIPAPEQTESALAWLPEEIGTGKPVDAEDDRPPPYNK